MSRCTNLKHELRSYGSLEIGGKTWGAIDRPPYVGVSTFPYDDGPDDIVIEADNVDVAEGIYKSYEHALVHVTRAFGDTP